MAVESWLKAHSNPSRRQRLVVSVAFGLLGALLFYARHVALPDHPGDFGLAWFGARSILAHKNPYDLVGPGLAYDWPWPLVYPGTAFVVALPFSELGLLPATFLFVFLSSALLAYSITENGWHRLPMFGSSAFLVAAGAAQWSPLFTAAFGIPLLASLFAAKPTIGIALGIAARRNVQMIALSGSAAIGALSLLLFPEWPHLWLKQLHFATQMAPPLLRWGGPFILVVLIRWKRPETRLVLAMACIPQVGSWYEALPIFLVARTYRETMALAFASLAGLALSTFLPDGLSETAINDAVGSLIVGSVYLPAVILVLWRRPYHLDHEFVA